MNKEEIAIQAKRNLEFFKRATNEVLDFFESVRYESFWCEKSLFSYGEYHNTDFCITEVDREDNSLTIYCASDESTYCVTVGRLLDILKESTFDE